MILRGIFLGTKEEVEWIYSSNNLGGPAKFNPISWNYFKNSLPVQNRGLSQNYILDYKKCFNGEFGKEKRDECLLSWAVLENSIIKLKPSSLEEVTITNRLDSLAFFNNKESVNDFNEPAKFFIEIALPIDRSNILCSISL